MGAPGNSKDRKELPVLQTKVTIDPKDKAIETEGKVWLCLEPFLHLEIAPEEYPERTPEAWFPVQGTEILFPGESESRNCMEGFSLSDEHRYALPSDKPLLLGQPGAAERVEFDLLNFTNALPYPQASRLALEADEHSIDLAPVGPAPTGLAGLLGYRHRPYAMSHSGVLTPRSGEIRFEAIEELRTSLGMFFSFCRAALTEPVILRGYAGASEDPVWCLADTPRITELGFWHSWSDLSTPSTFEDLYPGFRVLWDQEAWQDPLKRAIHWYARANSSAGGPDTALILSHSALEILSWAELVRSRETLSEHGFQRLNAADKIRLLLSQSTIPLSIPEHLEKARRLSSILPGHVDGPEIISQTRNSILHPKHSQADALQAAVRDSSQLALHYLELVLLRICGYQGVYRNRTLAATESSMERVPWSE